MYDDNYLNRRAAFWDNWRSSLEHAIKQLDADSSGKFVSPFDTSAVLEIRQMLKTSYITALKRYHTVLGEQIDAIDKEAHSHE